MIRSSRGKSHVLRTCAALGAGVISLLLLAAPVLAQGGSNASADSASGWVFRWINFGLLVAILVYGFSKAAPKFRAHAAEISQKIAEGTRAREAAEQLRREVRTKMAGIDAELAAMRADAKHAGEVEAERIRALAKSEAEMIERAARAEIAAAQRASRLDLRVAAARLAVERAAAMLREQMTSQDESALFRTFVAELERGPN